MDEWENGPLRSCPSKKEEGEKWTGYTVKPDLTSVRKEKNGNS